MCSTWYRLTQSIVLFGPRALFLVTVILFAVSCKPGPSTKSAGGGGSGSEETTPTSSGSGDTTTPTINGKTPTQIANSVVYYTVTGQVEGLLVGNAVTIQDVDGNNGTVTQTNSSTVSLNTAGTTTSYTSNFTLKAQVPENDYIYYAVTSSPSNQTCSVVYASNGTAFSMVVASSSIATTGTTTIPLKIKCITKDYSVTGTSSGLNGSATLQLAHSGSLGSGSQTVSLTGTGGSQSVSFTDKIPYGSNYTVSIQSSPTSQNCSVSSATGTNITANSSALTLTCTTKTYAISATLSGLISGGTFAISGTGITGSTSRTSDGSFSITTQSHGTSYSYSLSNPTGQSCTFSSPTTTTTVSGTLTAAAALTITCTPLNYSIGITPSALNGTLAISNGSTLQFYTTNSSSTIISSIAYPTAYTLTITTQPSNQFCTFNDSSSTSVSSSATSAQNHAITCLDYFTLGGTVTGLDSGKSLTLSDGGGNSTSITTNGSQNFFTLLSGTSYTLSITSQPPGQSCSVTNGSGTLSANSTTAGIACAAAIPEVQFASASYFYTLQDGLIASGPSSSSPQTIQYAFSSATTGEIALSSGGSTPTVFKFTSVTTSATSNGSCTGYTFALDPNASGLSSIFATTYSASSSSFYQLSCYDGTNNKYGVLFQNGSDASTAWNSEASTVLSSGVSSTTHILQPAFSTTGFIFTATNVLDYSDTPTGNFSYSFTSSNAADIKVDQSGIGGSISILKTSSISTSQITPTCTQYTFNIDSNPSGSSNAFAAYTGSFSQFYQVVCYQAGLNKFGKFNDSSNTNSISSSSNQFVIYTLSKKFPAVDYVFTASSTTLNGTSADVAYYLDSLSSADIRVTQSGSTNIYRASSISTTTVGSCIGYTFNIDNSASGTSSTFSGASYVTGTFTTLNQLVCYSNGSNYFGELFPSSSDATTAWPNETASVPTHSTALAAYPVTTPFALAQKVYTLTGATQAQGGGSSAVTLYFYFNTASTGEISLGSNSNGTGIYQFTSVSTNTTSDPDCTAYTFNLSNSPSGTSVIFPGNSYYSGYSPYYQLVCYKNWSNRFGSLFQSSTDADTARTSELASVPTSGATSTATTVQPAFTSTGYIFAASNVSSNSSATFDELSYSFTSSNSADIKVVQSGSTYILKTIGINSSQISPTCYQYSFFIDSNSPSGSSAAFGAYTGTFNTIRQNICYNYGLNKYDSIDGFASAATINASSNLFTVYPLTKKFPAIDYVFIETSASLNSSRADIAYYLDSLTTADIRIIQSGSTAVYRASSISTSSVGSCTGYTFNIDNSTTGTSSTFSGASYVTGTFTTLNQLVCYSNGSNHFGVLFPSSSDATTAWATEMSSVPTNSKTLTAYPVSAAFGTAQKVYTLTGASLSSGGTPYAADLIYYFNTSSTGEVSRTMSGSTSVFQITSISTASTSDPDCTAYTFNLNNMPSGSSTIFPGNSYSSGPSSFYQLVCYKNWSSRFSYLYQNSMEADAARTAEIVSVPTSGATSTATTVQPAFTTTGYIFASTNVSSNSSATFDELSYSFTSSNSADIKVVQSGSTYILKTAGISPSQMSPTCYQYSFYIDNSSPSGASAAFGAYTGTFNTIRQNICYNYGLNKYDSIDGFASAATINASSNLFTVYPLTKKFPAVDYIFTATSMSLNSTSADIAYYLDSLTTADIRIIQSGSTAVYRASSISTSSVGSCTGYTFNIDNSTTGTSSTFSGASYVTGTFTTLNQLVCYSNGSNHFGVLFPSSSDATTAWATEMSSVPTNSKTLTAYPVSAAFGTAQKIYTLSGASFSANGNTYAADLIFYFNTSTTGEISRTLFGSTSVFQITSISTASTSDSDCTAYTFNLNNMPSGSSTIFATSYSTGPSSFYQLVCYKNWSSRFGYLYQNSMEADAARSSEITSVPTSGATSTAATVQPAFKTANYQFSASGVGNDNGYTSDISYAFTSSSAADVQIDQSAYGGGTHILKTTSISTSQFTSTCTNYIFNFDQSAGGGTSTTFGTYTDPSLFTSYLFQVVCYQYGVNKYGNLYNTMNYTSIATSNNRFTVASMSSGGGGGGGSSSAFPAAGYTYAATSVPDSSGMNFYDVTYKFYTANAPSPGDFKMVSGGGMYTYVWKISSMSTANYGANCLGYTINIDNTASGTSAFGIGYSMGPSAVYQLVCNVSGSDLYGRLYFDSTTAQSNWTSEYSNVEASSSAFTVTPN